MRPVLATLVKLSETELIPGRVYTLEFDDCCVAGTITDRFIRCDLIDGPDCHPDDLGSPEALVFEHARITCWQNVQLTPDGAS
jgi:hypothetical protein